MRSGPLLWRLALWAVGTPYAGVFETQLASLSSGESEPYFHARLCRSAWDRGGGRTAHLRISCSEVRTEDGGLNRSAVGTSYNLLRAQLCPEVCACMSIACRHQKE
ncbi:hypothetical protein PsYK624_052260 [Phanerochaete sordida]|uniref:Secreted protein n=1 Tax=Phanerochaete sordida TaxID=48140 RepID=A0A9P3G6V1_9APHY|nr:hypothetical protein PsYK624_052260 [Phanerochaete sordida]